MYMSDLIPFEYDGQLVVDSRLIAEELGIQHGNFMETIYSYQTLIEQAFGIIPFGTEKLKGAGRPRKFALLNENQATFLMTLSDNTSQVVECKLKLVTGFSKAKEAEKKAFKSFRSNTYIFDKYFDRPIVPIIKF